MKLDSLDILLGVPQKVRVFCFFNKVPLIGFRRFFTNTNLSGWIFEPFRGCKNPRNHDVRDAIRFVFPLLAPVETPGNSVISRFLCQVKSFVTWPDLCEALFGAFSQKGCISSRFNFRKLQFSSSEVFRSVHLQWCQMKSTLDVTSKLWGDFGKWFKHI